MADYDDYTPVATDEEEERRRYAYPPAEPVSSSPSAPAPDSPSSSLAVMAPPVTAPMMGSVEDLEARASSPRAAMAPPIESARPLHTARQQLSTMDAAGPTPVQPLHGWKKALDIAGQLFAP